MFYFILCLFLAIISLAIAVWRIDKNAIKDPFFIFLCIFSTIVCSIILYSEWPMSNEDELEFKYTSQKVKILYKHEEHLKSSYRYVFIIRYSNGCILDKDFSYYEYQNKNVGDFMYLFYKDKNEFKSIKNKNCILG